LIRTSLDRLYLWSGYLAAFFLAAIGFSVVVQIVARMAGKTVESTEFAGFCLAASSFLGLAHTFRSGTHIRVSLLIQRAVGRSRRAVEIWCCSASVLAVGYLAVHATLFAWESYEFGDLSPGLLAIPFWIPQSGMALGLILMTVGLIDETVSIIQGNEPAYETNAETALE
jgi:TRAP-type C4-dicarboxylate transport system permease small subunit